MRSLENLCKKVAILTEKCALLYSRHRIELKPSCGRLSGQNARLRLGSNASARSYSYVCGHQANKELEMGSKAHGEERAARAVRCSPRRGRGGAVQRLPANNGGGDRPWR